MKTLALISVSIAALAAAPIAVASDGGTIAYHEFDENGAAQLWSVSAAGGAPAQLTAASQIPDPALCLESCFSEHPDWAFDGSRIYFDSDRVAPVHVFSMAPDGSDVRQVTHSAEGFEGLPGISPDGSLVAYDGQIDDTLIGQGIYVAPVDESGPPMRLTSGPKGGFDTAPEFSPDGSQIAFVRFRPVSCPDTPRGCRKFNDTGFKGSIYVVGVDGHGLRRLTDPGRVWGDPQWAPDGSKLLIQSYDDPRGQSRGLTSDLWTINSDGSGLAAVTNTRKDDISFSGDWSPSGDEITFVHIQFGDDHLEIQRMALDGSGRTTVAACGQFAFCDVPNWGTATPVNSVATASGARARVARAARTRVRHPRRLRRLRRQVRASVLGYPARQARYAR